MRKKSQAISINTIVVAAIALVVLILILLITTQNLGNWRQQTDNCHSVGGSCEDRDAVNKGDACDGDYQKVTNHPCYTNGEEDPDKVCCISV